MPLAVGAVYYVKVVNCILHMQAGEIHTSKGEKMASWGNVSPWSGFVLITPAGPST